MYEFDLGALWHRLIRGWKTPATVAVIAALLALASLPGSKPVYSVHMLIMPAPSEQTAASASGGPLSALLGIAGGGPASNYIRYQSLLFSNAVAQRIRDKYSMLQFVFQNNWDAKNHRWVQQHTLRGDLTAWLLRLANVPVWSPPDITSLGLFHRQNIVVLPSITK